MATITDNERAQVVDVAELKRIREELARAKAELAEAKSGKIADASAKLNASGGIYVRSADASGNIPEALAMAMLIPGKDGQPNAMLRAAMDYAGRVYTDADAYSRDLNAAIEKAAARKSRKAA